MDRPQYGEYASPEEQRLRAGLPPVEADAAVPADAVPSTPTASPQPVAHPVDRLLTFVLLGMGLVNVLLSVPGFLRLSDTLQASLRMLGGEGEFSNYSAARSWGVVAAIVLIVGYVATAWLSLRRLREGRRAWWVPLVGFAVTMLLVSLCISVPMFGDPAFTQLLRTPPA